MQVLVIRLALVAVYVAVRMGAVMDVSKGEHATGFDQIAVGEIGCDGAPPRQVAPDDMETNGLPYGAWCKCHVCGLVGRSTIVFDFYGQNGEQLKCENCLMGGK